MATAAERLAGLLSDRYRIERELGRGGMATVFLAEDTRHHRRVAIKVLHPELSAVLGPDRFLKEIELTANLQHPHILPLFDSGSADGLLYYVMPFVEGETLRGRLTRERQLPIPDAVRIATEVADALDYAHRHQVVHRDIKPENILLHDGRALVADFGIALAVEQAGGMRMTQTGISLGTPQYMAPEQAMGDKHVDHRADVYSLGAVVYEMLAGDPPFTGPTAQSIVARVVTEKPRSLTSIRDTVPRYLDDAVFPALQKLPADRPATAKEVAHLLAEPRASSAFEFVPAQRTSTSSLVGGIVLTAVLFGIAGYALGYRSGDLRYGSSEPSRLAMLTPELAASGTASIHRQIAITPDGKTVLYVTQTSAGDYRLVAQKLDAENAVPVANAEGLLDPVVSPDGGLIAGSTSISSETPKNLLIPSRGGSVTHLPPEFNPQHAVIGSDGTIWFTEFNSGKSWKLEAGTRLVPLPVATGLRLQHVFGDRRHALMVRVPIGTSSGPVSVVDLQTGTATEVLHEPVVEAKYAAGQLVYARTDGTLWAAPFDEKRRNITGPAVQVAGNVSLTGNSIAQFAISRSGNLAYVAEEPRWLVLVDRDGKLRNATAERRNFHAPQFSPDGSRISVDFATPGGRDVWILSLTSGTMSRASFDRDGHDATWSRDGQHIMYISGKSGTLRLYRTRPGGGSSPDSMMGLKQLGYTGKWLPSGNRLLTTVTGLRPQSGYDIGIVENGGKGPIRPLIVDGFQTSYPVASPNGKWLAFVSDKSGAQEVYVRPFGDDGDDVQVSVTGGTEPVWSPDGEHLFYRGNSGGRIELIEARIRESPSFDVVSRRALFPVDEMPAAVPHANYDISPDGRTFAMVRRAPATRVVVLQNLPALVKSIRSGSANPE